MREKRDIMKSWRMEKMGMEKNWNKIHKNSKSSGWMLHSSSGGSNSNPWKPFSSAISFLLFSHFCYCFAFASLRIRLFQRSQPVLPPLTRVSYAFIFWEKSHFFCKFKMLISNLMRMSGGKKCEIRIWISTDLRGTSEGVQQVQIKEKRR